jgi:hypothetical protein
MSSVTGFAVAENALIVAVATGIRPRPLIGAAMSETTIKNSKRDFFMCTSSYVPISSFARCIDELPHRYSHIQSSV